MNLQNKIVLEHFSISDKLIISVGFIFSAITLYFIYQVKPPTRTVNKKPIAYIEYFSNTVKYKNANSPSFYESNLNESLMSNDEVFTGENSKAVVRFLNSKTILNIPSSSLISIEVGKEGEAIEIKAGTVDISLDKNKSININTAGNNQKITATASTSKVKVYYSTGKLHLFTNDTGVKISNKLEEKKILPNTDSSIHEKVEISKNIFNVISPQPFAKMLDVQKIQISTDKKLDYQVLISKNIDFSSDTKNTHFYGTHFDWSISLDEGDYFLKLKTKDESKVIPITIESSNKITDTSPSNGNIINIAYQDNTQMQSIVLNWKSLHTSQKFKVITKLDNEAEKYIITNSNKYIFKGLKGNKLTWGVIGENINTGFSNVVKLNEVNLFFSGEVQLITPPVSSTYTRNSSSLKLAWKSQTEEKFLIKIINMNSGKILTEIPLTKNTFEYPLITLGQFRILISSLTYPTLKHAEYSFNVTEPILIWDKDLKNIITSNTPSIDLLLSCKQDKTSNIETMLHMTFTPVNGKTIDQDLDWKKCQTTINLKDYGHYCLFGKLMTPSTSYTNSDKYCFNFFKKIAFEAIPKATDSVLSLVKNSSPEVYKMLLPEIKNAVFYAIEVFSDKEGKNLIYSTKSNSADFSWQTDRSGIYYLRYKVQDSKNESSDYSPLSKFIFPISPMSDWKGL